MTMLPFYLRVGITAYIKDDPKVMPRLDSIFDLENNLFPLPPTYNAMKQNSDNDVVYTSEISDKEFTLWSDISIDEIRNINGVLFASFFSIWKDNIKVSVTAGTEVGTVIKEILNIIENKSEPQNDPLL